MEKYLQRFLEMHKKLMESGYYTDKEFHLKKRDEIVSMIKNGKEEEAKKEMGEYLLSLQLFRSCGVVRTYTTLTEERKKELYKKYKLR